MDWDFLSHQSMMLVCCCLASLCLQMTSGENEVPEGHQVTGGCICRCHVPIRAPCLHRAMLLLPPGLIGSLNLWMLHSFHLQPSCFSLANANPSLKQSWDVSVPLPPSGERGHMGASLLLPVREQGHSHSISFCPCLHPEAALPSAACSRMSAWIKMIYSNCSVSQL